MWFELIQFFCEIRVPLKTKAEIRNEVLGLRNSMDAQTRIEKSLLAAANVDFLESRIAGSVVSGFLPIRSEIDARPVMNRFQKMGARLCLPVVIDRETIVFRELVKGADLVDTGFGTSGPSEEAKVMLPQLMLMPLSAFDNSGARLGYGAGHYDRAIARQIDVGVKPYLVGLAFECQRVDRLPQEAHDKPLDAIITETRFQTF